MWQPANLPTHLSHPGDRRVRPAKGRGDSAMLGCIRSAAPDCHNKYYAIDSKQHSIYEGKRHFFLQIGGGGGTPPIEHSLI